MKEPSVYPFPKHTLRIVVGVMFFLAGLCFASYASRIVTIQQTFKLTDAALGAILFAVPVGLMCSLPFSGWIITIIGSRRLLIFALSFYAITLIGLSLAQNIIQLIIGLILFGFSSNAMNISVNTQAVAAEGLYQKPIMASFHGLWSFAGFVGAGIGTYMIAEQVKPLYHFTIIASITVITIGLIARYLKDDKVASSGPVFVMPDKSLIMLGVIAMCSMMCEGAMFDWSAIYFKKVVMAPLAVIGIGFTAFMSTMAFCRLFIADWFAKVFGLRRILQVSGVLTVVGLLIAVIFPYFYTAVIGFLFVGAGVSSVVPMVFSAAGKSKTMRPGVALAAVSTIGFVGILLGPPIIGFISGLINLRASFTFIAVMGTCVVILSSKAKLN
ncbi:MAG: MFS transporter [Mucilaginibacter sp.]